MSLYWNISIVPSWDAKYNLWFWSVRLKTLGKCSLWFCSVRLKLQISSNPFCQHHWIHMFLCETERAAGLRYFRCAGRGRSGLALVRQWTAPNTPPQPGSVSQPHQPLAHLKTILHTLPLKPLMQLLSGHQTRNPPQERTQESQRVFNMKHKAIMCLDPTSSWNFCQLKIAGTRNGSFWVFFFCISRLSFCLL